MTSHDSPMETLHERITIEPGKRSGKPCIRGMRITVYDVLSYLASGMTYQEILEDFPYLTQEDILACLSYAAIPVSLERGVSTHSPLLNLGDY
jgi:uncharacterized protein (DUF433 family)